MFVTRTTTKEFPLRKTVITVAVPLVFAIGAAPCIAQTASTLFPTPAVLCFRVCSVVDWHTLRHTCATLMGANGKDAKTIQELLRHASPGIAATLRFKKSQQ